MSTTNKRALTLKSKVTEKFEGAFEKKMKKRKKKQDQDDPFFRE